MLKLPDSTWRAIEAKTIEGYLAPDFSVQNPPSAAAQLAAEGYDPRDVSPHALTKTERYALSASVFILQTDGLVTGVGRDATYIEPVPPSMYDATLLREAFASRGGSRFAPLGVDLRTLYILKDRELRRAGDDRYDFLTTEYVRHTDNDTAKTTNKSPIFFKNGGGLADGVVTYLVKLQPAMDRFIPGTSDEEKNAKLAVYHDLAVLGLARATHHLAASPDASDLWDQIDADKVEIVQRGKSHTALIDGKPLIRAPQHPDPAEVDPSDLERPRLMCPAHASVPSREGTALKNSFHASINMAADRRAL